MTRVPETCGTVGDDLARLAEIGRTLLDCSTELADIRRRLIDDYERWAGQTIREVEHDAGVWLGDRDFVLESSGLLEPCGRVADCWYALDETSDACRENGALLTEAASLSEYAMSPENVDACPLLTGEQARELKRRRKPLDR